MNASAINRLLTLCAINVLKRFRARSGTVFFLSGNKCVKYGRSTHLSEASTMRFVGEHTSIPVPRVHRAFERKGCTYIVMDRIQGESLSAGWFERSGKSRAILLAQLKDYIEELRRVVPPQGTVIANVDGGMLYDPRLMGPSQFGPFDSIQSFHKYLRGGLEAHPDHTPEIAELIARQNEAQNTHTSHALTHGDLSSFNVLAAGDNIAGIIGWETAAWFPAYWEYTTACNVNLRTNPGAQRSTNFLSICRESWR